MKTLLFLLLVVGLQASAQTNTGKLADVLKGAPNHWTLATYGTYAPKLKHPVGGGVAVVYGFNDYIGTQVRLQYLRISDDYGRVWQPNAMLTLALPIHVKEFTFRPLFDAGVAADSKFRPYRIMGVGLGLGYKQFDIFGGVEKWDGIYNSFNAFQVGIAYHLNF